MTACASFGDVRGKFKLGFLYASDSLCNDLEDVVGRLKQETGIQDWVGTVGVGLCSTGCEYYDQAALVIMLTDFEDQGVFDHRRRRPG